MQVTQPYLREPLFSIGQKKIMFIGDNGEDRMEEIDILDIEDAGGNYGWNIYEGTECFENNSLCGIERK